MIVIRSATTEDSSNLYAWRNDEQTRLSSVSQDVVEVADHEAWLAGVLADDSRVLFIALLESESESEPEAAVGMCRFDFDSSSSAEVSINLNPAYRGRGLAVEVLHAAIDRIVAERGVPVDLRATIRKDNVASARAFAAVGFEHAGTRESFELYQRRGSLG